MAAYLADLNIELLSTDALKPYARNPRSHSPKQIRQIAQSIRKFGFTNPILIDAEGVVIAGHGRLEGAKMLGIKRVPVIRLDYMTEAQKRAYIIADNKLAENAGWDRELLALELRYISELDVNLDLTVTGFEPAEIDLSLQGLQSAASTDEADDVPEPDRSRPSVSGAGDMWLLGEQQQHRVLCADARVGASFDRLLAGRKAELVISDPPFNLSVKRIGRRGAIRHPEFAMASGEMSETEYTAFLSTTLRHLVTHSDTGSLHYLFIDWRHIYELLSAARGLYTEFKNLCVWNKPNGGMGSLYRSKHELIAVLKNGTAPHINNVELGRFGRSRTNVWDYAGANSFREGRLEELAAHPTPKPVALVSDVVLDASKRNGIVLDCFGGAGTTVVAAEKTGRRGYLMELDPVYVDVAVRRFEKLTGISAIHADTGLSFADVERRRLDTSSRDDQNAQRRRSATTPDLSDFATQTGSILPPRRKVIRANSDLGSNKQSIRPLKSPSVKGSLHSARRNDA
ncbi:MAG: site-specific DNA-methyltransferase [Candidatus Binataceae bacterium]